MVGLFVRISVNQLFHSVLLRPQVSRPLFYGLSGIRSHQALDGESVLSSKHEKNRLILESVYV
jgi:hypothetical protein